MCAATVSQFKQCTNIISYIKSLLDAHLEVDQSKKKGARERESEEGRVGRMRRRGSERERERGRVKG